MTRTGLSRTVQRALYTWHSLTHSFTFHSDILLAFYFWWIHFRAPCEWPLFPNAVWTNIVKCHISGLENLVNSVTVLLFRILKRLAQCHKLRKSWSARRCDLYSWSGDILIMSHNSRIMGVYLDTHMHRIDRVYRPSIFELSVSLFFLYRDFWVLV